jgi:putative peptidoglycan lipid II flippase
VKNHFARTALLITLITLVSKMLGFGRDIVMAAVFGATSLTDDYVMAQSIQGVVTAMLFGALGTTFLPTYSEYFEKYDEKSRKSFLNTIYTIAIVISSLLSLATLLIPRFLVGIFAPEFSAADIDITVRLLQVLVPVIMLTLLVVLDTAVLQVNGSFFVAVAIGIPSNIILILGMLLTTKQFGIYSLALSMIAGTAAQAGMLWIAKRKYCLPYRPAWNLKDAGVRRIGILVVPILLGSGISQINVFVSRALASGLPSGSIAAMTFSNRLSLFILGLISASVVSVFYASMSNLTATGQDAEYKSLLRNTVNGILLILIPTTAIMISLRLAIIRLIYEHGVFDRSASELTATALLYYSIGMVGFAIRDVFSRAFYARKDTRTAMFNGLLSVGLNIALALFLTPTMQLGGLALASSVSALFGTLILGISLYRKIGDFGVRRIGSVFLKVSAASLVLAFASLGTYDLLYLLTGLSVLSLAIAVFVGIVVYVLLVLLFRVDEAHKMKTMILAKIGKIMPVPTQQDPGNGL